MELGSTNFPLCYDLTKQVFPSYNWWNPLFFSLWGWSRHPSWNQLALATGLLKEWREMSQVRVAALQQAAAWYDKNKVKLIRFTKGDLVMRKVFVNTKEKWVGILGPNWEGPYRVRAIICPGTYELETLKGRVISNPWNAEHLRRYYL